jgi:signal peptidase I
MNLSLFRLARRALGLIWIALFAVIVGFSVLTRLAPLSGHDLFTIIGGSMEPSIPIGSLVVATKVDPTTVAVGDVVTIRADNGIFVTHRVIRVVDAPEGPSFALQGDANESADAGLVPARAIVGAANHYIPFAGYMRHFLSTIPGLVAALSLLGTLLLTYLLLGMLLLPAGRANQAQAGDSIRP